MINYYEIKEDKFGNIKNIVLKESLDIKKYSELLRSACEIGNIDIKIMNPVVNLVLLGIYRQYGGWN